MADDILLAPDVFVNASVALGSPPEHVVRRVLGGSKKAKSAEWILARVEAILGKVDAFKKDALTAQMSTIRGLVEIVDPKKEFGPDAWADALVAIAKAAGAKRVITDHPDLADQSEVDGVEFLSSDAWLVEVTTPPPPPPPGKK
ncbi:MAG: hypothetical protein H6721_29490 [Sandaracinus sp.]|nr:hypothetical protein [Sandaracinus sp.]MCB9636265.1 hypothetical protein [Sandaracinus sp.]